MSESEEMSVGDNDNDDHIMIVITTPSRPFPFLPWLMLALVFFLAASLLASMHAGSVNTCKTSQHTQIRGQ